MSRIDTMLQAQAVELSQLQDDEAKKILGFAQDARRLMRERLEQALADKLDEHTPYTVQHLRIMLAQAEAVVSQLAARINGSLEAHGDAMAEKATADLLDNIRANEPEFQDAAGRVETRILTRLTKERGLLLHQYSTARYSTDLMDAIQREMGVGLIRGFNRKQLVDKITAAGTGTMAAKEHRAELIARMESNRLYNDMHHAGLEEAAAELDEPDTDDPLLRQMDEFIDERNSPFSRAANGVVAAIGEPFRVPADEVAKWEGVLKRKSGVVPQWKVVAGFYEVPMYPAHFGDRGREVAYRASWDKGKALAKMKGPQRNGIDKPFRPPAPAAPPMTGS